MTSEAPKDDIANVQPPPLPWWKRPPPPQSSSSAPPSSLNSVVVNKSVSFLPPKTAANMTKPVAAQKKTNSVAPSKPKRKNRFILDDCSEEGEDDGISLTADDDIVPDDEEMADDDSLKDFIVDDDDLESEDSDGVVMSEDMEGDDDEEDGDELEMSQTLSDTKISSSRKHASSSSIQPNLKKRNRANPYHASPQVYDVFSSGDESEDVPEKSPPQRQANTRKKSSSPPTPPPTKKISPLPTATPISSALRTIPQVVQPQREYEEDSDQRAFIDAVVRRFAGANAEKRPIFLTGVPGCGKTFSAMKVRTQLIQRYAVTLIKQQVCMEMATALVEAAKAFPIVTFTSNAASTIPGAKTFHSAFGIAATASLIEPLKLPSEATQKFIRGIICLFYDELSLLHPGLFERSDEMIQQVRGNRNFFGGIIFIGSGDFFQLPPVIDVRRDVWAQRNLVNGKPPLLFQTATWKRANFECVLLTKHHRQQKDPDYARFLNRIRTGSLLGCDIEMIRRRQMDLNTFKKEQISRIAANSPLISIDPQKAYAAAEQTFNDNLTRICFRNEEVDAANKVGLESLPGSTKSFHAEFICTSHDWATLSMVTTKSSISDHLKKRTFRHTLVSKKYVGGGGGGGRGFSGRASSSSNVAESPHPEMTLTLWEDGQKLSAPLDDAVSAVIRGASVPTPLKLELKKGSQVACTFNLPNNKYIYNGLRGVVLEFLTPTQWAQKEMQYNKHSSSSGDAEEEEEENDLRSSQSLGSEDEQRLDEVLLLGDNGATTTCIPTVTQATASSSSMAGEYNSVMKHAETLWPLVRFVNGRVALMTPHLLELGAGNGVGGRPLLPSNQTLYMWAVTLKPAYAFTVHNQQGQTLKLGYIDVGDPNITFYPPHIFYVSGSRFPDLNSFAVSYFREEMIKVSPDVVRFYKDINAEYLRRKTSVTTQSSFGSSTHASTWRR